MQILKAWTDKLHMVNNSSVYKRCTFCFFLVFATISSMLINKVEMQLIVLSGVGAGPRRCVFQMGAMINCNFAWLGCILAKTFTVKLKGGKRKALMVFLKKLKAFETIAFPSVFHEANYRALLIRKKSSNQLLLKRQLINFLYNWCI